MTFYIRLAFTSGLALRIKGAAYFTTSKLSETDNTLSKYRQAHVGVNVRRVQQCGKVMIRLEVLDSNSIGDRGVHAGADRLRT
jgi:hypothetical protein